MRLFHKIQVLIIFSALGTISIAASGKDMIYKSLQHPRYVSLADTSINLAGVQKGMEGRKENPQPRDEQMIKQVPQSRPQPRPMATPHMEAPPMRAPMVRPPVRIEPVRIKPKIGGPIRIGR